MQYTTYHNYNIFINIYILLKIRRNGGERTYARGWTTHKLRRLVISRGSQKYMELIFLFLINEFFEIMIYSNRSGVQGNRTTKINPVAPKCKLQRN
jgi:hypothetical protein